MSSWHAKQKKAAVRAAAVVHPNKSHRTPKADRWEPEAETLYGGLLTAADVVELRRRRAKFAPAT